jgi:cobalt/nickel transport system permease protein
VTEHGDTVQPLPTWLTAAQADVPRTGRRLRRSFVDRFIGGAARVTEAALEPAEAPAGLLGRVDPRVKLVTLLALLVVTATSRSFVTLGCLAGLALLLALLSGVGLGRFALRAYTWVPLFTVVIALPAVTSWVTPGDVLLGSAHGFAVTAQGVETAARLVLRVTAAVSFSVLLTLTTRWDDLLRSLRVLRVPRTFVFVLAVAYRYTVLLVRLLHEMVVARRSRTVGRVTAREDRRFAAAAAGALFGRSQAMGEQVYAAMLARGYDGEPRTLERWRLTPFDLAWSAAVAVAVALALWTEHSGV